MGECFSVDFHAHILPNADHGASDVKESLSLLRTARGIGIQLLFATPHFYPHEHTVAAFLARRAEAYAALMEAEAGDIPCIRLGAEVLLCPFLDQMEGIERLCPEGTKLLLIELPFSVSEHADDLFDTLERLIRERGFTVVLAHPNRYHRSAVERALSLGCLLQINAEDVVRIGQRRVLNDWFERGAVVAVGSDAHKDWTVYRKLARGAKRFDRYVRDVNRSTEAIIGHQEK